MLAVAFVLAIEDAQEMFQRNNVLYVYSMCMCMRVGVWTKSRVFLCYGRRFPPGETMEGE
jgi:hypothetical protein